MGLMTDPAAPRGNRTMQVLFRNIKGMTLKTEFLNRHDKGVRPLFVACIAHFCGIGTMGCMFASRGPLALL